MNHELRELVDGYLNGTLSEAELSRLESLLQNEPASKRDFVAQLILHGQLGLIAEELRGAERQEGQFETKIQSVATGTARSVSIPWRVWPAMAVAASLLVIIIWFSPQNRRSVRSTESSYDLRPIPIRTVGYVVADRDRTVPVIAGSSASIANSTEMNTAAGTSVSVVSESRYGFASETSGLLFRGEVLVSSLDSNREYAVEMENIRVVGRNAKFRVLRSDDGSTVIDTLVGQIEIQSRGRAPRLSWSFDTLVDNDGKETDSLALTLGDHVSRTSGLLGPGALRFVDRHGTCTTIIGGTEAEVGGGLFSMSGGMTIEAVITSSWDGADDNHDVIFRKEDGPNRILLSLQNNANTVNDFAFPKVPNGPVLSFGIFLRELGYSELDLPLDGKDGRPTVAQITDGKPHIIAATYDSFSGMKSIAIDGKIRFSHQFMVGHCIQSGGPKPAMIGGWRKREAFGGVIDELAIYDYALSPQQIAEHAELASRGSHTFQQQTSAKSNWTTLRIVQTGESVQLPISAPGDDAQMMNSNQILDSTF